MIRTTVLVTFPPEFVPPDGFLCWDVVEQSKGEGDQTKPHGNKTRGGGTVCLYPDTCFRVCVVGTLPVQHHKHVVTWVLSAHPPVHADSDIFSNEVCAYGSVFITASRNNVVHFLGYTHSTCDELHALPYMSYFEGFWMSQKIGHVTRLLKVMPICF